MAGVTVIVPAAVAAGLTASGASAGKPASAVQASSMLAMVGARAANASSDDTMRLPDAARNELAKLEFRREQAERAAGRAAARRAAKRAAALRAQQAAAAATPAPSPSSQAPSDSAPQPSGNPQQIASAMLGSFGWSSGEFGCLVSLWNLESGWNVYASNPSGAYGIPQALPGSKMASAGPDWQSNAATQIRWGLGYIKSLYGSPCGAWSHEQASGWY
jgi:biotin carboxyl carrier protein